VIVYSWSVIIIVKNMIVKNSEAHAMISIGSGIFNLHF